MLFNTFDENNPLLIIVLIIVVIIALMNCGRDGVRDIVQFNDDCCRGGTPFPQYY